MKSNIDGAIHDIENEKDKELYNTLNDKIGEAYNAKIS